MDDNFKFGANAAFCGKEIDLQQVTATQGKHYTALRLLKLLKPNTP